MTSLSRRHSLPIWTDASGTLSPDSLNRLEALTAVCLGYQRGSGAPRPRVTIVSLPERQAADVVVSSETSTAGSPTPSVTLPRDTRAFARIVLRDAEGDVTLDEAHPNQLALLVSCTEPREWTTDDVAALRHVAGSAASELRLRANWIREARTSDELRDYPLHDPVTELANRELFLDRVRQALIRAGFDRNLAVMSLTADQVPNIETTFGFEAAQDVIRELARRLKVVVRNVDSVGRLAGDEFGVLLELLRDDSDAARVAKRIHESLRAPVVTAQGDFMLTASIGVALAVKGRDSASRMIQLARLARDRANATGAAYEMFDPDMQARAHIRLHQEMELRRAVEDNEFDVHYQPIVALATGRIVKIEALVRWRHPTRGLLDAAEFIGLAEETGLVVAMDWSIVARGCQQLQDWIEHSKAGRELGVSVNITASQLKNRDLCDGIKGVLESCHLSKNRLNLEVTEGTLIGDVEHAKTILNQLRELGVSIHLDDFGTGYSSLHILHELPLDAIKIDRRFIARLGNGGGNDTREAQIVATICQLARQMGLPIVAEGVETKEQLAAVKALKCEFAQGYLFSRPIPPAEMGELLASDRRF